MGYSDKSHMAGTTLSSSVSKKGDTATDREKQLSGWAFPLAAGSLTMFLVMVWTASNINAPVISSVGCALAVMAFCKACHEKSSGLRIFALFVLFLFVVQAFMARSTMDKALKNIPTMNY